MNKELLNRMKLLMEYDTSRTLSENKAIISEQEKLTAKIFGQLGKDAAEEVFQNSRKIGGLRNTSGKALNSADDLSKALKAGQVSAQTMGKVRQGLLKSTTLSASKKTALIDDMVASPNVINKYKGLSKNEIVSRFKTAGYGDDVAEEIGTKLSKKGKVTPGGTTTTTTTTSTTTTRVTTPKPKRTVTGKNKKLKPKRKRTIKPKTEDDILTTAAQNPGWNWKRWLKWGAGIGITAGVLWWFFYDNDEIPVPDDIPDTQPDDGGDDGTVTIPSELGDIEGVKKFQDWADTNHAGWAYGYPDGKVNKAKGYGKFGPRTRAAWAKYKDEYLKAGTPTPTATQAPTVTPTPVEDNQVLDGDTY